MTFDERRLAAKIRVGIAVRRWRDRGRHHTPATAALIHDEQAAASEADRAQRSTLEEEVVNSLTLSRALSLLAPPFREALLLVASQGLTYKEAAEVLGEPVGTVKWRVSEATSARALP